MQQAVKLWAGRIIGKPVIDISAISDTMFMKDLLSILQPDYFHFNRFTNFEEILQSISEYYRTVHRMDASNKTKALKIKKDNIGLWELFLGIAIKCPRRNTYIKMILELDEESRIALMNFINMITEDCPEIMGNESRIEDGKDEKLEKALITTIDDLTEENTILKEKIDSLTDNYDTERQEMKNRIEELKEAITGYEEERVEIFDAYEAEYVSDSLVAVFKTIQEERNQLRSILENREAVIANFQASSEQISRDFTRLKEQNKQMKKQHSQYRALEKKLQDMELEITELKNNEKKYLDEIYKLEQKLIRNPRETVRKTLAEETKFHEVNWDTKEPSREHRNSVTEAESGPRALSEIFEVETAPKMEQERPTGRASIRNELKPLLQDQNNVTKVRELQKEINNLNDKIIGLEGEIEYYRRETSDRDNKIQGLESKIVSVERLNKLYADTIHQRDSQAVVKQHDYQGKYTTLMEQIQELKVQEQHILSNMESNSKQSEADKSQLKEDYNRQVERVSSILQQQLLQFKERELEYLETIRKLNGQLSRKGTTDIEENYSEIKPSVEGPTTQQQTDAAQEISAYHTSQRASQIMVEDDNLTVSKMFVPDVRESSAEIAKLEKTISQMRNKCLVLQQVIGKLEGRLAESIERQSQLLGQLQSIDRTVQQQQLKIDEYRNTILARMQEIVDSARMTKAQETLVAEQQTGPSSEIIQQLMDDIQKIRQQSVQQLDSIIKLYKEHSNIKPVAADVSKQKIREYIRQSSKETVVSAPAEYGSLLQESLSKLQSLKQSITLVVNENQQKIDSSVLQSLETHYKQLEEAMSRKDSVIQGLNSKLVDTNNRLRELQNENNVLAASRDELSAKVVYQTALTAQLEKLQPNSAEEGNSQFLDQMSKLIEEVNSLRGIKNKQTDNDISTKQLEDRIRELLQDNQKLVQKIKQMHGNTKQTGYIQALRQSNVKLVERMQQQNRETELFRKKYCQMYDRHRSILQQNEVLVSVLADMRSTARA